MPRLQSFREARRRQLIVAPERDLRRRRNSPEVRLHVVSENGIRLLDEVRHRLRRPAADERRQRLDVVWLFGIQLRREAPGENRLE